MSPSKKCGESGPLPLWQMLLRAVLAALGLALFLCLKESGATFFYQGF